jgi:cysteine synthase A
VKYYDNYIDLMGNTPLVKLNQMNFPKNVNVFAKLELMNPGGSVKDRMGKKIIEVAEKSGKLKSGGTIIEATAGNAGIGIAFAAIGRGYKVIFVVPLKYSQEKQDIMRILGAEIINTPKELGMVGALEKLKEILKENPDFFYATQFTNQANVEVHFETTGPEIFRDLEGNVDYLVAGAGSGGTITGAGKFLKSKKADVKVILADPVASIIGGNSEPGCSIIEGIGNSFIPEIMDTSIVDHVVKITDEQALSEIKQLAKNEGILAGTSSGANLSATRQFIVNNKIDRGNFVVILTDRGDRYLSKGIFN